MALVSSFSGFIFDYGGVLVHDQTEADQAGLAEIAGVAKDRFAELYWSHRLEYDKGLISAAEYWQSVADHTGKKLNPDVIDQLTAFDNASWMRFDSVMWDWISKLRSAGKRVAMLSNMPRELGEALKVDTTKLNSFDQVTLSYEVHAAKPEPAIYQHCLEALGTPAEETLFLDDRIANVQGAELLGMRAIHFTSSATLTSKVDF